MRDKDKLCLVRELHNYELFQVMSCGNKQLLGYINEHEITDTYKTGKTRKKLCSRNKPTIRAKKKIKIRARILYNKFLQLDKKFLLEALTTTNESLDSFFHLPRSLFLFLIFCDN